MSLIHLPCRYLLLYSRGVLKPDIRATLRYGLSRLLSLQNPIVLHTVPQAYVHGVPDCKQLSMSEQRAASVCRHEPGAIDSQA